MNLRRRLAPANKAVLPTTIRRISSGSKDYNSQTNTVWLLFLVVVTILLVTWIRFGGNNMLSNSSSDVMARLTSRQTTALLDHPFNPTPPDSDGVYDLIVIGAGPAGLTAALFGARASLSVLVLGSTAGGLLSEATSLENFPSFRDTNHASLWLQSTQQQARLFGATFAQAALKVTALGLPSSSSSAEQQQEEEQDQEQTNQEPFTVATTDANTTFQAWSVVLATGATPRRLHLPGEDALWGNYLHSCAICDGSSYTNADTVLVVGGGDSAVQAALYLSRIVAKVVLVHRQPALVRPENRQAVQSLTRTPNIVLATPFVVEEWKIQDAAVPGFAPKLTGATLRHVATAELLTVECRGAFLMIGADPNTAWLQNNNNNGVQLDASGFIIPAKSNHAAGMRQATSVAGVFAAGEIVADDYYRQAITAAAQGAQAAMDAERWLAQQHHHHNRDDGNNNNKGDGVPILTSGDSVQEAVNTQRTERRVEDDNCNLENKDCILALVKRYPVVVFAKTYCPYCQMALEALTAEGVAGAQVIHVIELDTLQNCQAIQSTLASFTGRRTVPNVFVGGTSIGGGDETVALSRRGELKGILRAAGAIR